MPGDTTPCDGGPRAAVTVLDTRGDGRTGCEVHGALLLAYLGRGAQVVDTGAGRPGAARRVFHEAARILRAGARP